MGQRVVFVHPAIRPYRAHLYKTLQENLDIKFYFIGFEAVNRRWLEFFRITNYEILQEQRGLGYRSGVSFPLLKKAVTEEYDIWIGSTLYAFTTHFAYPIVKARGKRFVLWSEDWYWGADFLSRSVMPLCRWILRGADLLVVAGSKHSEFVCQNGASKEKVAIAYNSYSPFHSKSVANSDVAKFLYTKRKFRILYLGRILEYKGLDTLIEAYAPIERKYNNDTELLIVGSGPFEEKCRSIIKKLRLANVIFLGRADPEEIEEFYRHVDVFVHPCRWRPKERVKGESWGFVINEAMSVGLPTVTTSAVGAAYDLIEHGKSGFVIPPEDREALTRIIETLYLDAPLRNSVGQAAKARIHSLFTPEKQAKAFLGAIQSLA